MNASIGHENKGACSSLFEYCVKRLGLSESEAFYRLTAARLARRFPVVFAMVERREIHLSAVCLLRDYLTLENHQELLQDASRKAKFQVQELLARRFPRPDVASRIRKLPSPVVGAPTHPIHIESALPVGTPPAHTTEAPVSAAAAAKTPTLPVPSIPVAPARASIEPTSEARYRIQLNASVALKEKLERFKALVSHSVPSGDIALVFERALDLALAQVERQRFAKTERPRSARTRTLKRTSGIIDDRHGLRRKHREHIPNAVQRQVAARDGLRCTYVSDSGCRCSARAFLQIHHEQPWARGGASTTENLRLLCASHNRLSAERDFGAAHVAERRAARGRPDDRPPAK